MKAKLFIPLFFLLLLSFTVPQQKEKIYVASKKSNVYHLPTCKWAKKIKVQNYIEFKSIKEAEDAGYRPCKVCKPNRASRND